MRIKLCAFQNKLVGYMEVPENTTPRFDLILTQPVQAYTPSRNVVIPLMDGPLNTRCTFEWTGMIEDDPKNSARIYQLTKIS